MILFSELMKKNQHFSFINFNDYEYEKEEELSKEEEKKKKQNIENGKDQISRSVLIAFG